MTLRSQKIELKFTLHINFIEYHFNVVIDKGL